MPRALFEKRGNAVWMSHLDLMRLFQRAFKRAGLKLTHTQGFNPRPSVSIALPLSVGIESGCELLDFDLDGQKPGNEEICQKLNEVLVDGVQVLSVYDDGAKIKHLALLDVKVCLEYDSGIPAQGLEEIEQLFRRKELLVEKKGKNGTVQQDIIPMIRAIRVKVLDDNQLQLMARICCQNPTLNPMQLSSAIEVYLPHLTPDFVRCSRIEIYDINENLFR